MNWLYLAIVVGIVLWLTIIFQTLVGMRIVKFKGPDHWKAHRYLAFALIVVGLLHGIVALGLLVFGWF